jgi:hypothetical protein
MDDRRDAVDLDLRSRGVACLLDRPKSNASNQKETLKMKPHPQHPAETVLCALAHIDGIVIPYGLGIGSGDLYGALECNDPETLRATLEEASRDGERGGWHPCGLPLVRLDWLAFGERYPLQQLQARWIKAKLKRALQQVPLQFPN